MLYYLLAFCIFKIANLQIFQKKYIKQYVGVVFYLLQLERAICICLFGLTNGMTFEKDQLVIIIIMAFEKDQVMDQLIIMACIYNLQSISLSQSDSGIKWISIFKFILQIVFKPTSFIIKMKKKIEFTIHILHWPFCFHFHLFNGWCDELTIEVINNLLI